MKYEKEALLHVQCLNQGLNHGATGLGCSTCFVSLACWSPINVFHTGNLSAESLELINPTKAESKPKSFKKSHPLKRTKPPKISNQITSPDRIQCIRSVQAERSSNDWMTSWSVEQSNEYGWVRIQRTKKCGVLRTTWISETGWRPRNDQGVPEVISKIGRRGWEGDHFGWTKSRLCAHHVVCWDDETEDENFPRPFQESRYDLWKADDAVVKSSADASWCTKCCILSIDMDRVVSGFCDDVSKGFRSVKIQSRWLNQRHSSEFGTGTWIRSCEASHGSRVQWYHLCVPVRCIRTRSASVVCTLQYTFTRFRLPLAEYHANRSAQRLDPRWTLAYRCLQMIDGQRGT